MLQSKSWFYKLCLEFKNTLKNMWGKTKMWNPEYWPLGHRTLTCRQTQGDRWLAAHRESKQCIEELTSADMSLGEHTGTGYSCFRRNLSCTLNLKHTLEALKFSILFIKNGRFSKDDNGGVRRGRCHGGEGATAECVSLYFEMISWWHAEKILPGLGALDFIDHFIDLWLY